MREWSQAFLLGAIFFCSLPWDISDGISWLTIIIIIINTLLINFQGEPDARAHEHNFQRQEAQWKYWCLSGGQWCCREGYIWLSSPWAGTWQKATSRHIIKIKLNLWPSTTLISLPPNLSLSRSLHSNAYKYAWASKDSAQAARDTLPSLI